METTKAKKVMHVLDAHAKNARQFTCPAETKSEENVTLLFQEDLAARELEVVRLSLDGLPKTHQNQPVDWVANFGIREKRSGKYVDVSYTLLIKPRPGRKLVYFDGTKIRQATYTQAASLARNAFLEDTDMVAVTLNLGDPGVGWDGQN